MKIKILMVLITFFDLVSSNVTFASSNNRYSRARRTKLAGSRGGTGGTSSQKKRKEQNLMEDYSRFLFSSYNKTLQYGQSYNLQDMLKYDVHKYYKEHGSQDELNEQFCFGPYMKLTSNITGTGGEVVDLRAGDGTVCTYIKPNTNYAITLTDATEKQISNAVKKNATPCMTSADKRRVCITRNGQDLQTMHLTTEMYLDTKPHITAITEAINKVKTSCGDFTKSMATINSQLGLGVSLTSGLGMALSGAATAVGYMNYKATGEQEEMLADYKGDSQQKFRDALFASPFDLKGVVPLQKKELKTFDWSTIKIDDLKLKEGYEVIEQTQTKPEKVKDTIHTEAHKLLCQEFMDVNPKEKGYIRKIVDGTDAKCKDGATPQDICVRPAGGIKGQDGKEIEKSYVYFIKKSRVKDLFGITPTTSEIFSYLTKDGNCCKTGRQKAEDQAVCEYPYAETIQTNQQVQVDPEDERKLTSNQIQNKKIILKDLQEKLKADSDNVKALNANHKKSRNLDIATAALSGTSALSSGIGMGMSIAAIQSVEKSIIQLKQCKKDINDLRMLNNKYVSLQDEADTEGD